jgi:Origin of replication binding protein
MTTSKFIPLNKRNGGCPVCGEDDGSCRRSSTDYDFILCKTHVDAREKEIINGYVCVKPSNGGHTASFKPDTGNWTEEAKREWKTQQLQEQQLRQKRQQSEEKERQEKALSASERHQFYSEVLDQLTLDPATVTDLRRRGFSDKEIAQSGFKSVRKFQRLNKTFDMRLPGVNPDGKTLAIGADGYLCPVRDFDGQIGGLQLRLHNPSDGGRYRWLSTPDRATLKLQPEDENPLVVFHPDGEVKGIAIIEGTGAKPYFVSQRLDLLTIGAAGGQWLGSEKLLEKYINQAIAKYGNLPINLIPDAGWALNPQVKQKLIDTLKWLKSKFPQVEIQVLDWNQIHKSQGDIDELEDLSITRKVSAESFLKKYKELFGEGEYKGFAKRFQNWAQDRVKLSADIIQHEKWLTIPEGIQNECDILLIRKSLGGGKTQALIDFLKPLTTTSLLVGYRNSLLNNTIARANEMGLISQHIRDVSEVVEGYHVNFANDETIKLWAGCADSFFKFNAIISANPTYYLIHDEICSVLGHLKGGGTLKGRQKQAIEWDTQAIKNSQFSIMMDANLSDREVDFIRQLFPEKRVKVLDSIHSINPRKFYFIETAKDDVDYTANPKFLPSQLVEKAKAANRVLWISDSQRSCEIADEILTKHGHKHFRLDGKTSHDELAKQFQSDPKTFITTEKLDSLSISPSGESGLSIDLYNYFDAVCFDIKGTVSVNTLTQLSARLRDTNVPIYVACPEFVNMTSDPCPYAIKSVSEVMTQRLDMLIAKSMEVDGELVDSQFVANMFADMGQKFASDPWFIESLKDSKELKYEHSNLKLCLKTALVQAGHHVIDLVENCDDSQHQEVKQASLEVKRREAEKVFNSEDINWEQAQQLSKKDVNYNDKCKIRKARIKHKLPGIENTASWNADFIYTLDIDKPKFIDERWRLMQLQNDELAKAVFKFEKKYNFENGFTPQEVWKANSTKIEALKLLGVGKLIEAGVFSCQDDWVRAIVDEYYDNHSWFELIGIPRAKQSNKDLRHVKTMIDRFLGYFGLESKQGKRNKDGQRWYTVQVPQQLVSPIPSYSYINSKSVTPISQNQPEGELTNYLTDIDICLARRAEIAIASSQEISLSQIASNTESQARTEREWEEKHQVELNKRMLENNLTRNGSDMVSQSPSISYIKQETATPISQNQPEGESEWSQPENIQYVTQLLEYCENAEMLADLRECDIPPNIFRIASRHLPIDKREQIRDWVLQDNELPKPPI